MANLNKVLLIGNLTSDPELKYTQNGMAVTNFTIAINHSYAAQNGERKEETDFIRVRVLGKQGENCAKYLNKGRPVFVEGRLQFRTWESTDGQKKSSLDVIGYNIQFLGKASGSGDGDVPQNNIKETANKTDMDDNLPPVDDVPF
ncbi:single-stranded DNA-binding protein [Candidatus Desantisbacteria bacterium]|nr:single-stranded DNA-binding protein [Candidatus Desantisbacteria bacterium]